MCCRYNRDSNIFHVGSEGRNLLASYEGVKKTDPWYADSKMPSRWRMGVFCWSGPTHYKGGEKMYYIGIDVHKSKCVPAIKQKIRDELVIITFENIQSGINDFICKVKDNYMPVKAVCESTANYWIVLHDSLGDVSGL